AADLGGRLGARRPLEPGPAPRHRAPAARRLPRRRPHRPPPRLAHPTREHHMTSAWIIVPTFCEVENLVPLLERIQPAIAACHPPVGATVLVVDDASPDGTGALAGALARTRPWLQVLHREGKGGLAGAYV